LKKFIALQTHFFFLLLTATLYYGIAFIFSDFYTIPSNGIKDICVLACQWMLVCVATCGLLYLLAINKYIWMIVFPLLTLLCSILAYFRYTANIVFSTMILDATLHNDLRTSLDLITPQLIIFVTCNLFISLIGVWYRFKYAKILNKNVFFHLLIAIILLFPLITSATKRPVQNRMPMNLFFVSKTYFEEQTIIAVNRLSFVDPDMKCSNDSLIVVFVIGESLRADHLGLNGYLRNTTPLLEHDSVISLPHIFSEYTYTNASLPHILTRADSAHTERAYTENSFISIFKQCHFETWWITNQEAESGYVYFINECDSVKYANKGKLSYNFDRWTDSDLLPYIDEALLSKPSKKLLIIHTIGSHWYYNSHYTDDFQKFNPITKSKVVSSNTPEQMINSYDNTVLYTDAFLHSLITRLKDKNVILMYLSDHGETLGENGLWLHALAGNSNKNPACFVWMSDFYKKRNAQKVEMLTKNATKHYRSDFLFHSILDAATIDTKYKELSLSIFN